MIFIAPLRGFLVFSSSDYKAGDEQKTSTQEKKFAMRSNGIWLHRMPCFSLQIMNYYAPMML